MVVQPLLRGVFESVFVMQAAEDRFRGDAGS